MACGALCGVWVGCSDEHETDLVARGARAYRANCVVCHNPDPTREGSLGPPIAGSSLELLEARILRAEYPPGYTPKKDSKLMPQIPGARTELEALAAFLATPTP